MSAPDPTQTNGSESANSTRSTSDRILDAAEELFAARGLAGTSVRDIAAEVDLNPASLYNHFASKQALYEAVLERGVRPLVEVLEQAAKNDATDADGIIEAVMQHLAKTPQLPRLIHHETLTGGENLKELTQRWIRPLLVQALATADKGGEPSGWEPDEMPCMIAAWLHMIFGHFAMAPMLAELFNEDPMSPESLERQTRFLRKAARRLMNDPSNEG